MQAGKEFNKIIHKNEPTEKTVCSNLILILVPIQFNCFDK